MYSTELRILLPPRIEEGGVNMPSRCFRVISGSSKLMGRVGRFIDA
jgi:hypothetical protein